MVQETILKNKDGEDLKTTQGEVMKDYKLENGDIFIAQKNKIFEKTVNAVVEGKKKTITNYKIVAKFKDFKPDVDLFITLTPAQAKSLKKKQQNGVDLTQIVLCSYVYQWNDNDEIGVGVKNPDRKPVDFSMLENDIDEDYLSQIDEV